MAFIRKILGYSRVRSCILLSLAILCLISLISYNPSDPSLNLVTSGSPHNMFGYVGSYLADFLYQLIGLGAFILPACCLVWAYFLFIEGQVKYSSLRFLAMIAAIGTAAISFTNAKFYILPASGGGILGKILWHYISKLNHISGMEYIAITLAVITSLIFFALASGIKFLLYFKVISMPFKLLAKIIVRIKIPHLLKEKLSRFDFGKAYVAEEDFAGINKSGKKKIPAASKAKPSGNILPEKRINAHVLPDIELLDNAEGQKIKLQSSSELASKSDELLKVLGDFGVKGRIVDVRQGPVVTMYEFEPAAGTKSSRVVGLSDDIARSLSAVSTRISVIPGKNALGIELPNKQRAFFRLRELIATRHFQDSRILLPLILGKDLGGEPLIVDLARMPHLLIAGTTGSGKSVAINAMILSLLYRYTPEECRMIMIDPKMLELSAYDNIPHLMTPVVTEPEKAVVALKWAVKEMENRYRLMSHLGVRNIANYNSKIAEAVKQGRVLERKIQTGFDPETGKPTYETVPISTDKMPFIVVIVDEMADLMLVAGKDIESSIQRLAQMARAAGIHIIMATQRPSVDVITGVIKANFPSRVSFKVTSKIDSRTILGEQGAEQLLGMGDMLYMGSSSRILRVHGPFVDDKEVEKVTNFLRSTASPEYISAVTESTDGESDITDFSNQGDDAEGDLYNRAVNIVRTQRKSSISYIQRSLRIGYNRAANLVEQMEKEGILSEPNSTGKREILLPEG